MNEQDKNKHVNEDAPKLNRGQETVAPSAWKRMLSKKWVSPAAFMAAAAIIVTLMWIYQGTDSTGTTTKNADPAGVNISADGKTDTKNEETLQVANLNEVMQWPVMDRSQVEVSLPFYDAEASATEREQAMLVSGTTFTPHMAVDLAKADNGAFDVVAAMSGRVTSVQQHPTNGYTVEITHGDNLVTVYQSLSDIKVNEGDEVKQGTIIAKAGRSELEKDQGVHVHFEVREDGKPINPNLLLEEQ
ncbi:membrane protein [Paenibacillus darwinianus]|uniref:Membrane protein n=1 Tax=Paenibacillus darwinianus TaxID=1380763 RepID=A0A9W5W665_9BACL|nr:M23 family metallopeptidase [Paenibacillus darwinianus]EXX85632.1 membrane protein [Paenibacillus darwinianus]EXX85645.1 membrane protein [Paenibacillus darwinianus]EXX88855.1 membrane protein [Paenibacillus darwinianus]